MEGVGGEAAGGADGADVVGGDGVAGVDVLGDVEGAAEAEDVLFGLFGAARLR